MKKALSLIMALMMLFALSINALAAKTPVVGEYTGADAWVPEAGVGETAFASKDNSVAVDVYVTTSTVVHKYAVDIEYDTNAVQLEGGVLEWDVNNMRYEFVTNSTVPTGALNKEISVINYSDLDVKAWATVVDENTDADKLVVSANYNAEDAALTVAKATPAAVGATKGTPTTETITLSLTPTGGTWDDVVDFYTRTNGGVNTTSSTFKVATATVHIARAA